MMGILTKLSTDKLSMLIRLYNKCLVVWGRYIIFVVSQIKTIHMNKILLMMLLSGSLYSQGVKYTNLLDPNIMNMGYLDSLNRGDMTYRVQVLTSTVVDLRRYGKVIKKYRCGIEYSMLPSGKELYRYMVEPKTVNCLDSALLLMEEMSKTFENPYIVFYKKGVRIN